MKSADPWRFFFLINPVSRVLVAATLVAPSVGAHLSRLAIRTSMALDALGAERVAMAGATVSYGLEYFRGMRHEAGLVQGDAAQPRRVPEEARAHRGSVSHGAASAARAGGARGDAFERRRGLIPTIWAGFLRRRTFAAAPDRAQGGALRRGAADGAALPARL